MVRGVTWLIHYIYSFIRMMLRLSCPLWCFVPPSLFRSFCQLPLCDPLISEDVSVVYQSHGSYPFHCRFLAISYFVDFRYSVHVIFHHPPCFVRTSPWYSTSSQRLLLSLLSLLLLLPFLSPFYCYSATVAFEIAYVYTHISVH